MKSRVGTPLRGIYMGRFVGRCLALVLGVLIYVFMPEQFDVLPGMAFLSSHPSCILSGPFGWLIC